MTWISGQPLKNGEYTIERELGRGRFGITYLTKRSQGDRWVIKILNPQVLAGLPQDECDRLRKRHLKEAFRWSTCKHPNIVKMQMPFEEGNVVCLPMEYLDGNSLGARSQTTLVESVALNYIQQIGAALEVVHSAGLVHRDVRPSNIFLRIHDGKAEAVLTDFGLADDIDSELTRTRKAELMDGFSPIELYARGKPAGPYTDVYSLAATLYELLTGVVPVSASDRRAKKVELISPQAKKSEISARTTKAILEGMSLEELKRPQSVQAWLEKLQVKSNLPEKTVQSAPNWTKWQTIWGAIGVIVALLTGIRAWLMLNKSDTQPTKAPVDNSIQYNPLKP